MIQVAETRAEGTHWSSRLVPVRWAIIAARREKHRATATRQGAMAEKAVE